jgi:hypothetical protein
MALFAEFITYRVLDVEMQKPSEVSILLSEFFSLHIQFMAV